MTVRAMGKYRNVKKAAVAVGQRNQTHDRGGRSHHDGPKAIPASLQNGAAAVDSAGGVGY